MAAIWEQRFARLIRGLAGLRESTTLELLPDLMPVAPVVDPASVDQLYLRGERRAAAVFTSPAVAARHSVALFQTATVLDPRLLTVIDRIVVFPPAAATEVALYTSVPGIANVVGGLESYLDLRAAGVFPALSVPRGSISWGDVAPASYGGTVGMRDRCLAGERAIFDVGLVLAGLTSFQVAIVAETANVAISGYFQWRERVVDAAELLPP